jgi:DNA-binding NtrC family response regulator
MPFNNPRSHVLSVDDNEDSAEILGLLMKPHQVEVTYARSGEEALSKIKLDYFDLFNAYVTKPDVDALIETMLDLIAKTKVYDADAGRAISHVPAAESRSASLFFNVRTASD